MRRRRRATANSSAQRHTNRYDAFTYGLSQYIVDGDIACEIDEIDEAQLPLEREQHQRIISLVTDVKEAFEAMEITQTAITGTPGD